MGPRSRARAVLAVAALGGAGTMVVELAAVRLLAPWFGSSHAVWTNVIAVVLLALAAGYLLGGRLAGRDPLRRLGLALLLAGLGTAWLPAGVGPVARTFLPDGLRLHEAAGLVLWGSLASSLLLFLVPATLLGTVAPLAVQAIGELRGVGAGRAGGTVLFASTLGSLGGVFGTSHVLLPELGLARTFLLASACLVGAGLLGLRLAPSGRGRGVALALLAGWGAAFGLGGYERPAPPTGMVELARAESPYQSVRVVEEAGGEGLRYLQVNESFDSYQSVWQPEPGLLPEGFYYNDFALPAGWAHDGGPWGVLVLGLGGGTALRVLEGALPPGQRIVSTGVELDPVVVELARRFLDLAPDGPERRTWAGVDARVALRFAEGPFQQVVLDCYANQVEIPPHLCTLEFFREVRARLAPGGWLSANLGGFGFDDPVVDAVARTCAAAFESEVLLLRVPRSRNLSLVARRGAPVLVPGDEGFADAATPELRALVEPRRLPGMARVVVPGRGELLRDDRCPVERLQRRSIEEARERLAGLSSGAWPAAGDA